MASDPSTGSCSPEDLVAQAIDSGAPSGVRDAALRELQILVQQTAARCARRLIADEQVRRDLVDQGFLHVYQRLGQYDPQQGAFLPWLQVVLYHFGQTLRRNWNRASRRRRPLEETRLAAAPAADAEDQAQTDLAATFAGMREHLDRCAWPPARAVDYYAVLLVFLRVETVNLCHKEGAAPRPGEAVARAAAWLPWRPPEEARRFRAGLVCLGELWQRLAGRLEQTGGLGCVLEALNEGNPPGGLVGYETLAQWSYRARQQARNRLGAAVWNDHGFAGLLSPWTEEAL